MAKRNRQAVAIYRRIRKPGSNSNPKAATIAITIRIGLGNLTKAVSSQNNEKGKKQYTSLDWRPSPS